MQSEWYLRSNAVVKLILSIDLVQYVSNQIYMPLTPKYMSAQ